MIEQRLDIDKHLETDLRHSVAVEALLASLAMRFANSAAQDIDRAIQHAVAQLGQFLDVDRSYVCLLSADGRTLSNDVEWCAPGVRPQAERLQQIPLDRFAWIFDRLQAGEVVALNSLDELPLTAVAEREEFLEEQIQSLLNVPLIHGGQFRGFVGFDGVRRPRAWSAHDVRILRVVATLFASALERKRVLARLFADLALRKQTEQALREEQQLLRQLLDLHERDRKVVAYEIHDGLAQELTGALFQLQAFERWGDKNAPESQTFLQNGLRLLASSIAEARRLIGGLRPPILDEAGIVGALEYLAVEMQSASGPAVRFEADVPFLRLASPLENALFRIAQEAVGNACRHSQTREVALRLTHVAPNVRLEIQDWGVGFDEDKVGSERFGLRGIRERARLLGGNVKINTGPGRGTLIVAEMPCIEPETSTNAIKQSVGLGTVPDR